MYLLIFTTEVWLLVKFPTYDEKQHIQASVVHMLEKQLHFRGEYAQMHYFCSDNRKCLLHIQTNDQFTLIQQSSFIKLFIQINLL